LPSGSAQYGHLALFWIDRFGHLVGTPGLVPIDILRVIGLLVEALGSVTIENRSTEGGALDSVPVTARRTVPARQHELEGAAAWFAEQRHRIILQATGVFIDMVHDLVDEFGVVKFAEDLFRHGLLIARHELVPQRRGRHC